MTSKSGSSPLDQVVLSFTATEQRILDILNDGEGHTRDELMKCLEDELARPGALHDHLKRMRRKLLRINQTICCVAPGKKRMYRRMILFVPLYQTEHEDLPPEDEED